MTTLHKRLMSHSKQMVEKSETSKDIVVEGEYVAKRNSNAEVLDDDML